MKFINKVLNKLKNYHPSKREALCFLLIPIFIGILRSTVIDSDTWFILNYGRYILNNGFPTIDPFTIHEGLHLVIQQWLVDIIFYKGYDLLGNIGIYIIVNIINLYIVYITYKILMLITDNKRNLSVLVTVIITSLFDLFFLTSRPQIFSTSILLTELYLLEKYRKTRNIKVLYTLPLLSVIMINCHASMWLMLFCFYIPIIVESFKFKIGNISSMSGPKFKLLLILILMIMVGIINPYGINAMTYVITSYNVPWIYYLVDEMKTPNIHNTTGIIIYTIVFAIYIIYIVFVNKKISVFHFLLLLGTTYLALSSNRGICFFIIASIYPIAYYLQDKFYVIKEPKNILKTRLLLITCIIVIGIIPFLLVIFKYEPSFPESVNKGIDYLISTEEKENIRLYCSYEECNYAEYLGIKTYSDSRAEIFLKVNNKKEDVLEELYQLTKDKLNIEDFLTKYDFTHLIVHKETKLYEELIDNKQYKIIFEHKANNKYDSTYIIFKKI